MATRDSFPAGVAEQLKWYVYRLIDPRNGETFYVGKGQKNRVLPMPMACQTMALMECPTRNYSASRKFRLPVWKSAT